MNANSNMSTIVKKKLVQSHDRYVQLTTDVMWVNLTLFNQSALFTIILELEIALIQLTHQVDELQMAVQHSLSGKLPMTESKHFAQHIEEHFFMFTREI